MNEKKVTFDQNSLIGKLSQGEYHTKKEMTKYGEFTLKFPTGRDYQVMSQRKSDMFGGANINSFDLNYRFSVDRDMTLSVCITEYPADYPKDWKGLDIGPKTIELYISKIRNAGTVIWNGPMGVFEMDNFAEGTMEIAKTLADATSNGTVTVIGGGDSAAAISKSGLEKQVSHVSTGGGASLEFLEGKILPGVAALTDI